MDLIFRHINLVRMEKEIMNEKIFNKRGLCECSVYYIFILMRFSNNR